ncbi:MAG: hypothetical protein HN737_11360 [Desulfobacterales bacterium]|nr:hypothetical protein [Desulfobacterales bacterium]
MKGANSSNSKIAAKYYTNAIKAEPSNANIYILRAISKRDIKDYKGALDDINKVIKLEPDNIDAYYIRGDLYKNMDNRLEGFADFKKIKKIKIKGDIFNFKTLDEKKMKDVQEDANKIFDSALYKFKVKKDFKGAAEDIYKHINIIGKPVGNTVLFYLALAEEQNGNINKAIITYTTLIQHYYISSIKAYKKRSVLKKQKGDELGALVDMEIYKNELRIRMKSKISKWDDAIKQKPKYSFAYLQRAKLKIKTYELKSALKDINTGLKFSPDNKRLKKLKKKVTAQIALKE